MYLHYVLEGMLVTFFGVFCTLIRECSQDDTFGGPRDRYLFLGGFYFAGICIIRKFRPLRPHPNLHQMASRLCLWVWRLTADRDDDPAESKAFL